jgi:hypothetical protein
VTSFASPPKEFRLMSEMFGILDITIKGKRFISCMMNRSGRRDMAMIQGKNNGAPNIIGRGWGKAVDVVCRRSRPIYDITGRGWR